MSARLDAQSMLLTLADHGVKCVVIGGMSAVLQDIPVPETADLDITPEGSRDNLRRLGAALREMEATLRAQGLEEGHPIPLDERTFTHSQFVTFETKHGPFDVSLRPDGTDGYPDLRKGAVEIGRFGITILVASVEDLIRSKQAAGRQKDLEHLAILRRYMEEQP